MLRKVWRDDEQRNQTQVPRSNSATRSETRFLETDEPVFGSIWIPEDAYVVTTRETHSPEKEWEIVIVHDMRIVNASASPGWCK